MCKETMRRHFNKRLTTNKDEVNFKKDTNCHICDKQYTSKDVKVRDHCHITGLYRGSAHNECNLKLQIKPENVNIPVIFHNLKGYDSHFIMQQIGKTAKNNSYTNKKGKQTQMNIKMLYQTIWKNM